MRIIAIIFFSIGTILLAIRYKAVKNQNERNEKAKIPDYVLGCFAAGFEMIGLICLIISS